MYIYIYIYILNIILHYVQQYHVIHTSIYTYIYIYTEREREIGGRNTVGNLIEIAWLQKKRSRASS